MQHIDVSGFEPVRRLPDRPILITEVTVDGEEIRTRYDDELDEVACERIVEEIRQKFFANQMQSLTIQHRSTHLMWFEFGEGCCTISYDARTSQEGGYHSYRNGSRTRKMIPFFKGEYPTYMVCQDVDEFIAILSFFLEKDKKPGKRQNVKWVWAKR